MVFIPVPVLVLLGCVVLASLWHIGFHMVKPSEIQYAIAKARTTQPNKTKTGTGIKTIFFSFSYLIYTYYTTKNTRCNTLFYLI